MPMRVVQMAVSTPDNPQGDLWHVYAYLQGHAARVNGSRCADAYMHDSTRTKPVHDPRLNDQRCKMVLRTVVLVAPVTLTTSNPTQLFTGRVGGGNSSTQHAWRGLA